MAGQDRARDRGERALRGHALAVMCLVAATVMVGGCTAIRSSRDIETIPRADGSSALSAHATSGSPGARDPSREVAPAKPTAKGAPLQPVYQPPRQTMAMLDPKAVDAHIKYRVVFRPYGPPSSMGMRMVVLIDKSVPSKKSKKAVDFRGRNVLVLVSPGTNAAIKTGGSYSAELRLVPREGLLVPELDRVRPVKA